MAAANPDRMRPIWRRWLNVLLRGLHLVAVIALGAALLGAPLSGATAAMAVAATGLAMFAIDTWNKPSHLREVSGLAMIAKLVLVAWMALDASVRLPMFWLVVAGSAIFAHAPSRFRHAVILGRRP